MPSINEVFLKFVKRRIDDMSYLERKMNQIA